MNHHSYYVMSKQDWQNNRWWFWQPLSGIWTGRQLEQKQVYEPIFIIIVVNIDINNYLKEDFSESICELWLYWNVVRYGWQSWSFCMWFLCVGLGQWGCLLMKTKNTCWMGTAHSRNVCHSSSWLLKVFS